MNVRVLSVVALSAVAGCGGDSDPDTTGTSDITIPDVATLDGAGVDIAVSEVSGSDVTVSDGAGGEDLDATVLTDADEGPDALDALTPDAGPKGPCNPNPCAPAPTGNTCDGSRVAPFAAVGLCTEVFDGVATCSWPAVADGGMDCAANGQLCVDGSCQAPGSASEYAFQPSVTFLDTLVFSPPGTGLDADGDGSPDDTFGELLEGAAAAVGEGVGANALLQGGVDKGVVLLIFEYAASAKRLDAFQGVPTNTAPPHESLAVQPSSFLPGTAVPRFRFTVDDTSSDHFHASGDAFELQIPLKALALRLPIHHVVIVGVLDAANPNVIATGTIGGVVSVAEWAQYLNQTVAAGCSCMGLGDAPMVAMPGPNEPPVCNPAATSGATACSGSGLDRDCRDLPFYCFAVAAMFAPSADIDADGDGTPESISISIDFHGVPVSISGVGPI